MAKISAYTDGTPALVTDQFIVVRGGQNRRVTLPIVQNVSMGLFALPPYTVSGSAAVFPIPANMTLTGLVLNIYLAADNDNSNFWTIALQDLPAIKTFTSRDTKTDAHGAWFRVEITSFAIASALTSDVGFVLVLTKTLNPGDIFIFATLKFTIP